MAENNPPEKNTGEDEKALAEILLKIIKRKKEYKDLTDEARESLEESNNIYKKISDKLKNIANTSVDVKGAQIDALVANQQFFAANQKVNDLLKSGLGLQDEKVKLAMEERDLAEKSNEAAKTALEVEKQVNKQLGFSGKLTGIIAEKLGFGAEMQARMTLSARQMVAANGKAVPGFGAMNHAMGGMAKGLSGSLGALGPMGIAAAGVGLAFKGAQMAGDAIGGAMKKAGSAIKGLSEDSSDFFTNLTEPLNEMVEKIPLVGGLLSGIVSFWSSILDLIIGVDNRIVTLGRQMGMSASAARAFNDSLAGASDKIFATQKALMETQVELAKLTGLNNVASKSNLEANIELSKFAGLEADARKSIYETSLATGRSTRQIASNVMGQVAMLKKATGISFNYQATLKEAAGQSGRLGLMFTKYPDQLTKSLLLAKSLGFELKELEGIGDGMLDFEQSLTKEFEAQLITGKNLNLMGIRDLFNRGKLAEAAAEITKQVGSAKDFLEMERYEAQSLAGAMEMSVDQMAEFLKKQQIYSAFGAKDEKGLIERVRLAEKDLKLKKQITEEIGKQEYANAVNLSMQEKLMESFNKIKEALVGYLTKSNILDKLEHYINLLSDPKTIEGIVERVRGIMSKVIEFVAKITDIVLVGIDKVASFFLMGQEERDFSAKIAEGRKMLASGTDILLQSTAPEKYQKPELLKNVQIDIAEQVAERALLDAVRKTSPIPDFGFGPEFGLWFYKTFIQDEKSTPKAQAEKVNDVMILPGGRVLKTDQLDYTFALKNVPGLLNNSSNTQQMSPEMVRQVVSEVMNGMSNRPIIVQSHHKLEMEGRPVVQVYDEVVKRDARGYDVTFGPMRPNYS